MLLPFHIYKYVSFFVIGSVLIISACQTVPNTGDLESLEVSKTYPLVDQALWPHYQQFEEEAIARGYSFDLNALEVTGTIDDIIQEGVIGVCQYGIHDHDVTIDLAFWNSSSELTREFVVFHELGHCVLFQEHREGSDNQGNCLSLMNSGTTSCRVAYTRINREYYIDELFEGIE